MTNPVGSIDAAITRVDTVIVGAGFAGLGLGIRLARQGRESFVILERAGSVGGTWRDNTYPGVACDIPSHLYSYSFLPKPDWSSFFAPGAEILEYLRECVRSENIGHHLRLSTEALEMRWMPQRALWSVQTNAGLYECETLVMAAGRLSNLRLPEVTGLESFGGELFHSSQWNSELSLSGKRVGVVGSGASAVQMLPDVARVADSVVVFQRSAPYIVPRPDRTYSEIDHRRFERDPQAIPALRSKLFWTAEVGLAERLGIDGFIDRLRTRALGHLAAQVSDPELVERLTPEYEIGCKRVLLSNDYYPALMASNVTLESSALERVTDRTAVAANGSAHELDILILATGFESTRPAFATAVFDGSGRSLSDAWQRGMQAFASTAVSGFPNLFIMDGPNASLGHNSAVFMIEAQIDHILGAQQHRESSGQRVLDVSAAAQDEYVAQVDGASADTVWLTGGCQSWYVDERTRRLTLLWPDFAHTFRDRVAHFEPEPYRAPMFAG